MKQMLYRNYVKKIDIITKADTRGAVAVIDVDDHIHELTDNLITQISIRKYQMTKQDLIEIK